MEPQNKKKYLDIKIKDLHGNTIKPNFHLYKADKQALLSSIILKELSVISSPR
ncbi:MAG: hypothetical protein GW788_00340 [Ignavibacteria bacterium]|nr:hypothetical protein [Ignavibacteria bacterium]